MEEEKNHLYILRLLNVTTIAKMLEQQLLRYYGKFKWPFPCFIKTLVFYERKNLFVKNILRLE